MLENFNRLNTFIQCANAPPALIAIPYFRQSIGPHDIKERIRKSFIRPLNDTKDQAYHTYAAEAVLSWRESDDTPEVNNLIALMIARLGIYQMRGLAKLISVVERLLQKGYLNEEDNSLISIVPLLFDTTNYVGIPSHHESAAEISLVRGACVRLANKLINKSETSYPDLERITEESRNDPLPEVRYTLENTGVT